MKSTRYLHCYTRFKDVHDWPQPYPEIRLAGNWLLRAGFNPEDQILVEVKQGELVIRKGDKDEEVST